MPTIKLQKKLYSYLNKSNKSIQIFLAAENEGSEDYFQVGSDLSDAFIIRCVGGHVNKITYIMNLDPDECMVFRSDTPLHNCT
jgi:hypothetical protein